MIRPAAGMPRPRGVASCHALLPNVALSAAKWHPHASLTAASLTPVQAVALEAELRVNRQRLAAAPKNAARAEIELERRADLQFLRMQNDQARRRRGVAAALRMSVLCGAVRCSGCSRGRGVGLAATEGLLVAVRGEEASGKAARRFPECGARTAGGARKAKSEVRRLQWSRPARSSFLSKRRALVRCVCGGAKPAALACFRRCAPPSRSL